MSLTIDNVLNLIKTKEGTVDPSAGEDFFINASNGFPIDGLGSLNAKTGGTITFTAGSSSGRSHGADISIVAGGAFDDTSHIGVTHGGNILIKGGNYQGTHAPAAAGVTSIQGGDDINAMGGAGGLVEILGGQGSVTDGTGGGITIQTANGDGIGSGGQLNILAGGVPGGIGDGGDINIQCATFITPYSTNSGLAGSINLSAGISNIGSGGSISLLGGDVFTSGIAGGITLTAGGGGSTSGNGANVSLVGGFSPLGTPGSLIFTTGGATFGAGTERFRIDGTGAWLLATSAGTAGFFLASGGVGAPPTWSAATGSGNPDFNLNNQLGYAITASLASSGLTVAASHRAILRTAIVTNITAAWATVNADINYGGTTPVLFTSNMPIPGYGTVDLDLRSKVLLPGDLVRFQANAVSTLHVTLVWEDNTTTDYVQGTVANLNLTTINITDVFTSTGTNGTVLESILVVNTSTAVQDVPVQVVWTDASNVIQGYYCYNLMISYGGTVELLENPVRIPTGYKVRATAGIASTVAVHVSGKNV